MHVEMLAPNIGIRGMLGSAFLAGMLVSSIACGSGEKSPDSLTIYSGRSAILVDPIMQQYSDATGVDVKIKYASSSQLAATLLEEGDNSTVDLFFAQDPGSLEAVEELLAPLPTAMLEQVPEWARSPQGKWVGISGRARTVVYNSDLLEEHQLPDDLFGFVDPQWKGRIGWAPSNASFQTMISAMRAVWGEERTVRWLDGIQANDPKVYPKNTPQVAAVASGEIDVGLVNHYYLFRFLAEEGESFPARNYHPRSGGPGAMVMVAGAGILSTADNPDTAEKFLNFMLSEIGQLYFTTQTFEYPLVERVKTHALLVPLEQLNIPDIQARDLVELAETQQLLRETGVLP